MEKDYKKLYEEALERAKIKRDEYMRLDGPESYVPQDIEYVFPELKESEDEKVRKTLLHHFEERIPLAVTWYGVKTSDIIAWLKKQKEQKPNFCHHEVDFSNCSEEYRKAYYDGWNNCNQQHEQMKNLQKPAWSEEDEKMFRSSRCYLNEYGNWLSSKNEEKSLAVYKACDWLYSLKDRVQQPKQELSEEDYNEIETIACHLDNIDNEGMAEVLRSIRDKYWLKDRITLNKIEGNLSADPKDWHVVVKPKISEDTTWKNDKTTWTEKDEDMLSECIGAVMAADWYSLEDKEEIKSWLQKKFGKNEKQ